MLSAANFGADDIVAITGGPAPDAQGNADGTFNTMYSSVVLNDNGNASFWASLNDTTGGFGGLFLGSVQSVRQIARSGQSVPQIPGEFSGPGLRNINEPLLPLNDNDQALFPSDLRGVDFDQDNGLFLGAGTPDSIVKLVGEGDAAPDGEGGFNGKFTELQQSLASALNNAGQVAFSDNLANTDGGAVDDFGIFRADASGNMIQIAREGGSPPDSAETFYAFTLPSINNHGQVAFVADVGVGWGLILRSDGDTTTVIADAGATINAAGDRFSDSSPFQQRGVPINGAGQVAFVADIDTADTATPRRAGVFVSDGTTLTEVARQGQDLGGGDTLFRSLDLRVALNDVGQVAFTSSVLAAAGGEAVTLLRGDGNGAPVQIARLQQRVPADDAIFFSFAGRPYALNDDGQIAFSANLLQDDGERRDGIFFYDDNEGLIEIARVGQTLDGAVITGLSFEGARVTEFQASNRDGFNNEGEVAFWFQLDNGDEGVAIVDPLAPEEGAPQVTGRVWLDADADGLMEDGEAGVAGVTVRLRDAAGGRLDETVTNDQGAYTLQSEASGDVVVEFLAPERHIYSWQDVGAGANEEIDSDAARGAGASVTAPFALSGSPRPQGAGLVPLRESAPWHNSVESADTDNNGFISINDVLVVVRHLRNRGFGSLESEPGSMHTLIDATGDDVLDTSDLLAVVAALRESLSAGGFGAGGLRQSSEIAAEGEPGQLEDAADQLAAHVAPLWRFQDVREQALGEWFAPPERDQGTE